MPVYLKKQSCRLASLTALWAAMITPELLHAQMIDLNGNGVSDIWELVYGAGGLDPSGDADGDGVSNGLEAIAGTNPFDSNSVPKIIAMGYSNTNFTVSMACALGKQ